MTVSNGPQRAAAAAGQADVALVVVGNNTTINGKENQDRPDIILPPAQDNLISAVAAANPNTVVVLKAGYPVAINAAQKSVPAILYSSHGGQEEGNFLADVLFGDYNPGGRLTETWFQSQDDLPPIADFDIRKGSTYWYFQGEPLYPFGHGLSYTTFTYSNFAASSGDPIQISVDVRNTGARAGDEVVQLYTKALGSKVQRPIQELKRFQRISLQPGETKTARFTLPVSELSFWDVRRGAFTVEKGSVDLRVGASSRDIRLSQPVSVNGETLAPRNARAVIRAENYDEYSNVLLGQSGDGVQVAASATDGAWLLFREVDFGAGVNSMTMRAGGVPGGVEAHLDRVDGPSMGTCAISPARSATTPAVLTCPTMTASGVHDLYLVFRVAASFYVDWFTFGAAASSGAPSIDDGGVVDAAGYTQPLLRGSWATVYGKNLARTTRGWAAADFRGAAMPQSLDGTQVLVNGVPAPVWYVSSSQVNFQVPSGVPLGPAAVQVLTAAGVSAPAVAPIDETQPAFFFSAAGGKNWAVAQHRDWSLIGPSGTPAQPGETIVLWGSGFGQTSPPVSPGFMQ
ncbi:MAG: glycoside hydrolase family 3 C-terminal domain-containing protein, partial [Acidobacteriia bacterium]|nr:glycoside hydrolase family 3 C-terminal domain-containing protein [Terriglobia bacterium]